MKYNKNQLKKVNDKKIMKKVKKQWVVVSIASFAIVGGFAVSGTLSMNRPESAVVAYADSITAQQQASNTTKDDATKNNSIAQGNVDGTNNNPGSSSNSNPDYQAAVNNAKQANSNLATKTSSSGEQAYEAGQSQPSSGQQTQYQNTASGFNDQLNNNQNTKTSVTSSQAYKDGQTLASQNQSVMNQGAQDAINGVAKQSQYNENNYYIASYDGANQAKADYNADTQGQGTNSNSYPSYKNTVQPAGGNSGSTTADSTKQYGNNPNITNSTVNGVPTGNSDGYSSKTNAGGADNPTSANTSVINYDKEIDSTFNGVDNTNSSSPVSTNSSIQSSTVIIPSNTTVNSNTPQNTGLNGINADIYAYGYNYFLANQAALDYESGKWQGSYYNSSNHSNTQIDAYLNSNPNQSTSNTYYQGYLGAQTAINNQWVSNTLNSNNGQVSPTDTVSNSSYFHQLGYQSAANNINKYSTAYVDNAKQLDYLMNNNNNFTNYKIINDINYNGIGSTGDGGSISVTSTNVNIDGQNHIADYYGREYNITSSTGSSIFVKIKNFRTIYGANYYGPFVLSDTGDSIYYTNINYVGSELLSAAGTNSYFNGNNNVHIVSTYTSPFGQQTIPDTNQQNMEVNNMTLAPGANYFGDTNFISTGDSLIEIDGSNGQVTLGQNSNMTLMPGGNGTGEHANGSSNYAINFDGDSTDSLNVNSKANLNIIPNNNGTSVYGSGIYNQGTVNINGGAINIELLGDTNGSSPLIYNSGKINTYNGGLLQVKINNSLQTSSYSNGLIQIPSGNINIYGQGNLIVQDLDNDSNSRPLINGSISVDKVGNYGFVLNKNGSSSYVINGSVNANNVSTKPIQSSGTNDWYYTLKLGSNTNNYSYTNQQNNNTSSPNNGTINGNNFTLYSIPTVDFAGPFSTVKNSDGSVTINGYAKIENYNSNANSLGLQYVYGNNNSDPTVPAYTSLNNIVNGNPNNTTSINGNGIVPFTFTVSSANANNLAVGTRLTYGITGNDMVANLDNNENVQHYSIIPDNSSPFDQLNNVSISQDAKNGYSSGLSDAHNNNSINKQNNIATYNASQDFKNAYDSANSGYNYYAKDSSLTLPSQFASLPNSLNIMNANAFTNAYNQAKADLQTQYYKDGYTNYLNGTSYDPSITSNSNYQQGQNDAQAGFYNGLTGKDLANANTGSSGYSSGKNQGQKYRQAYTDAVGKTNADNYKNGNNPTTTSVYNAINQAFTDAQKNTTDSKTSPGGLSGDALNAYNLVNADAIKQYTQGKSDYLSSGKSVESDSPTSQMTETYNAGITDAQAGYTAGSTSDASLPLSGSHDSGYINAYYAALAAHDAMNNTKKTDVYSNNTNGYSTAYDQANQGYKSPSTPVAGTPATQTGMNYANGVAAFENDSEQGKSPSLGNNDQNQGYTDAQNGYKLALQPSSSLSGTNSLGKTAGFNYGKSIVNGATTNTKPTDQTQLAGYNAAQQAKNDLTNGNNAQTPSKARDVKIPSPESTTPFDAGAYQSAYYGAYEASQSRGTRPSNDQIAANAFDTRTGANDYLSGHPQNAPAGSDANAYKQGFTDAQNGYQKAISNTGGTAISTDGDAEYNQGVKQGNLAQPGYQAAENQSNPTNGQYPATGITSQNAKDAFDGVADALSNAHKGQTNAITSGKSVDYVNAYNKAIAGAKDANTQGQNAFENGGASTSTSGTTAEKAAYATAYSETQTGYQTGISNPNADTNNMSANAKVGFAYAKEQASDYSRAETDYYKNGINSFAKIANGNKSNSSYVSAIQGLVDGSNSNNPDTPTSANNVNNKPMYEYARARGMGIRDGLSNAQNPKGNSTPTSIPESIDASNKDSYSSAYTDAYGGYKDGITALNNNSYNADTYNQSNGSIPKQNAYQTAKNDFDNGFNAKVNAPTSASDNKSNLGFTTGFNSASGAIDATTNVNNDSLNADPSYSNAKAAALKGMQQGAIADNSGYTNDVQKEYYNIGLAAQTGSSDAGSGIDHASQYSSDKAQQLAYTTAQNDFKAGAGINPTSGTINQTSDAFKEGQAYQKGKLDAATGKNDPSADYTGKQKSAYEKANDNYNAGLGNKVNDTDNPSFTSITTSNAYIAGQNALQGTKDAISNSNNGKMNPNLQSNPDYSNAYQAAQHGVTSGNVESSDDKAQQAAYDIGQAAQQGLKDAINPGKQVATNYDQLSQAAKNAYDTAQANYNSALAGDAKDSSNASTAGTAVKTARNEFNSGLNMDTDKYAGTENQSIYQNAYTNYQKGYKEGLGQLVANTDSMNPDEQAGYNESKNLSAGYKKALDDFYNKGVKNVAGNISDNPTGYKDAINGLIDGINPNKANNLSNASNKQLYELARAQSLGTQNGIIDARNDSSINSSNSSGSNNEAYQDAYTASKSAYQDGNSGNYDASQADNPVYTNSFDRGAQQKGIDDYLNGNSTHSDGQSPYATQRNLGIDNAKAGFSDATAANGSYPSDPTKVPAGLSDKPDAYQAGYLQGVYANKGYNDAANGTTPTLNTNPNNQSEIDAYWGAIDGVKPGASNTATPKPNTNSTAYNQAANRVKTDAFNGARQYLNDKQNSLSSFVPNGNDLFNQGYNNQMAYDQGLNNYNNGKNPYDNQKSSQQTAYIDGQSARNSYANAQSNSNNPGSSKDTYNGAMQGFADAKQGLSFNPENNPKQNSIESVTVYSSAYANAYAETIGNMNEGARQYDSDLNSGVKPSAKQSKDSDNQDVQAFNQGYNNQMAYEAGLNDLTDNSSHYTDTNKSAYEAGFNVRQQIPNASNDIVNNSNSRPVVNSDNETTKAQQQQAQNAYDGAHAGYLDGVDGKSYDNNIGKSSDYTMAYNKAYGDMQNARAAGAHDMFKKISGNDLNTPDKINAAQVGNDADNDKKQGLSKQAYNNGFAEQQGYAAGLISTTNNENNPYIKEKDLSDHTAYDDGFNASKDARQGYQAAQNSNDPTKTTADKVTPQLTTDAAKIAYQAAAQAFKDAKNNKPTDNTNQDPSYQMAYNMAYNVDRNAMKQGADDALGTNGGNINLAKGQYPSNIVTDSAKTLYDQAKSDTSNGYNSVMDPSLLPSGANTSSYEFNLGKNLANNILTGVQSATKGDSNAPSADSDVTNGFNVAKEAIQNGTNDAKSGKNQSNGKLNPSAIQVPSDIPATEYQAYLAVYQGAYNGYNNGLNGGNQKPDATNLAYQAAYNAAFKQGQNDIPAPAPAPKPDNNDQLAGTKAGQRAFIGGTPLDISQINLAGKSAAFKKAFHKAYNESQNGFTAGLNGITDVSKDPSYQAGYKASKDYQRGVRDATRDRKPAKKSDAAYKVGYNAYNNGMSGKKLNKKEVDKLSPAYRKAYEQDYKIGHKRYVKVTDEGSKAGRSKAVGNNRIPRSLKHQPAAYRNAYMKAFNEEVKKNLPRYVYNLKRIYSHDSASLTRKTRVKKYGKAPIYDRHVFKVVGYKITSSGQVVYKVKGLGWIDANNQSVANVYYHNSYSNKPIQKVRVVKPEGTFVYNSKQFDSKNAVRKLSKEEVIQVQRIEKVGGITRFYIGNGEYISSNKTIVKSVH